MEKLNIDYKLLAIQKKALLAVAIRGDKGKEIKLHEQERAAIDGIICLCDAIQDYAVDELGMDKKEVFGK